MNELKLSKAFEICDALDDAYIFNTKSPLTRDKYYIQNMYGPRGLKFWKKREELWSIKIDLMEFTEDGKTYTKRYDLELRTTSTDGKKIIIRVCSLSTLEDLITNAKVEVLRNAAFSDILTKLKGED